MRLLQGILWMSVTLSLHADIMENYVSIANQIPIMEVRADPKALAWARSARSVLMITNDAIYETLMQANRLAKETRNTPFFCIPPDKKLDAITLQTLILKTYQEIASAENDKNKMTVSEVAWLGVMKAWPCQK